MRYLILGSSLRGLDSVVRTAIEDGHEVLLFDAEHPGAPTGTEHVVRVLPTEWSIDLTDGVDRVVTSPWFAETEPPLADVIAAGIDVITEAGFGLERLSTPVVAVTGTNGKTTVTEVTTAMLRASGVDAIAAGNIGTPVSAVSEGDAAVLVLELSSYQLRFIGSLRPVAATILNIAEDHLDWHGSFEAYRDAKAEILRQADGSTVFAYDPDDDVVAAIANTSVAAAVPCSGSRLPDGGNGVVDGFLSIDGHDVEVATADPTYRYDLVVAATLALAAGASIAGIDAVTRAFEPGPHRRERVDEIDGVVFINDSKATNPHAVVAAVAAYPSVILLAGGRNKGVDLSPIANVGGVKALIAFGEAGPEIAATARYDVPVAGDLEGAVRRAVEIAVPGDTVLLSPGCASFDEFDSYEARGVRFRELVAEMGGVAA